MKEIEKVVENLLAAFNVETLPVPVDYIASQRGLQVKPYDLGEGVSGVLVLENGTGTIGYNPSESKMRQRFTIAHELGHYELQHWKIPKDSKDLFVDHKFIVEFRNQESSTGENFKEQEANAFAAALLMPKKFVLNEIDNHNFNLTDEKSIKRLAKLFNVSATAMTFRIAKLIK